MIYFAGKMISSQKFTALALSSAVFLTAVAAVTLLSRAPFGEIYSTLLSSAKNTQTAAINLAGCAKPEVDLSVAEKGDASYIIMKLSDKNTSEVTLTIPASWHLEEVRGVYIQDIASYSADDRLTLFIPLHEGSAELRFETAEKFENIAFSHDSAFPMLVTFTRISLHEGEPVREVRLIERSGVLAL